VVYRADVIRRSAEGLRHSHPNSVTIRHILDVKSMAMMMMVKPTAWRLAYGGMVCLKRSLELMEGHT